MKKNLDNTFFTGESILALWVFQDWQLKILPESNWIFSTLKRNLPKIYEYLNYFVLMQHCLFYFFSWVENPMAQDWVCWTQMIERFCCLEFCTYIWLFQFEGAGVIQSSIIQVSPHPCLGDDLIPLKKNDSTSVLLYHIKFEKSRRFDGWLNDMSSVETLLFVGGWRSKIDGTVLICVYPAVYRNSYSCRWQHVALKCSREFITLSHYSYVYMYLFLLTWLEKSWGTFIHHAFAWVLNIILSMT